MTSMLRLLLAAGVLAAAPPSPRDSKNELPADVRAILAKADAVELYSLDEPGEERASERFLGRKVLGKVIVKSEKDRAALLAQLRQSVLPSRDPLGASYRNAPWHGVRVRRGEQTADLLLCFRGGWVRARAGGKVSGEVEITDEAQELCDRLLYDADVPRSLARIRSGEDKPWPFVSLLETADLVEVYSLDPLAGGEAKGEKLSGWKVLGKTEVKGRKLRALLRNRIAASLSSPVESSPALPDDFRPSHAVRFKDRRMTVELVVCFEGKVAEVKITTGKQTEGTNIGLVHRQALPVLDKVLTDAGVPLATKRGTDRK